MTSPRTEWSALLSELERIGNDALARLPDPDDALARARLCQLMLRDLGAGYLSHVHHDAEYPQLPVRFSGLFRGQFPNADDSIQVAPIDEHGVYRISGDRGTVHFVSVEIGSGQLVPLGTGAMGPGLAEHDLDALPATRDGRVEVVLSRVRPPGYEGTWWALDPGATHVLVRQRHYDWRTEISARLAIERLDRPARPPLPTAPQLFERLCRSVAWLDSHVQLSLAHPIVERWREAGFINRVDTRAVTEPGRVPHLHYTRGLFALDEGHALVLETDVPDGCRYWCVHLADDLACTLDYTHHQSTLNGHTARPDADGKFRAVVSPADPGVAHWLDTVGRRDGMLLIRWHGCRRAPTATVRVVALASLRDHMPADTRWVSAAQREEALRERNRAAQMRQPW
ncbi:MAG: DUF1214 domain-containing protein [Deltaproteobacteria bacterium]|nr:DUF1214 domain-containing protein [Deltaproteobacteria bacterium]